MSRREFIRSIRLPFVAFLAPFVLYVSTLAPTIYNLDSAELTTAAYTGGLVRATGYPLYLMIGRVWSRIPLGDVGFRMNLFSAVCGALTIALCACILRRLRVGPWAMFGGLGLLAVTPFFWAMSLVAEVYTLHTVLMCGLILLLLRWAEAPSPTRLAMCTLLLGLSCGNQVAAVLLAPACLWFVTFSGDRSFLRPVALVLACGGLALGLGVYLYLPLIYLTEPAFNYAGHYNSVGLFVPLDLTNLENLLWLVSGRGFAHSMFAFNGMELIQEVAAFAAGLGRASVGLAIGPAIVGLIVCCRRAVGRGGLFVLIFIASAGFFIAYDVVDKETMLLPPHVIWALWIGVGFQWLFDWAGCTESHQNHRSRRLPLFLKVVIVGAVLFAGIRTQPMVDLSTDLSARSHGEEVLENLESGALLIGWWDTVPVVEYLQMVEGRRPDIKAINRFLIDRSALEALLKTEVGRRPVYVDKRSVVTLPGIDRVQAGPVFRLTRSTRKGDP